MSSRGQGRVFQRGGRWWLDYSLGGVRHRESAGKGVDRRGALQLLRDRVTKRERGELVGRPDHVTLAELCALVVQDYKLRGNRSLIRLRGKDGDGGALEHLEAYFGAETKVPSITPARIAAYAEHRLGEGAARATIGYEKAALRRAFRLAIEQGLLATMPTIKTPKVENRRTGFFDEGELAAVFLELPEDVRSLLQFLAATGWRRDEARLLPWAAVDWEGGVLRLESARSKSGEPRVFPFAPAPSLKALLESRWQRRDGLYVFHRNGLALTVPTIQWHWKRACRRAGLQGRLVHDLRRTAARDMRRAGLAESDIMALAGWETREMFKRYCIRDEAALGAAVARRFKGTGSAQEPTPVDIGEDVS